MLVALGVAWYARGSCDRAAESLVSASDLDPENPTPYLFLGRMQTVETTALEGSVERLARFAQLQPGNALANYYYAVSLWKQPDSSGDSNAERSSARGSTVAEGSASRSEARRCVSATGDSLRAARGFFAGNFGVSKGSRSQSGRSWFAVRSDLEEAHYRLAQAYLRTGEKTKAQEELELHRQLSKKTKEDAERKRREIQQFVISLRGENSGSQPQH